MHIYEGVVIALYLPVLIKFTLRVCKQALALFTTEITYHRCYLKFITVHNILILPIYLVILWGNITKNLEIVSICSQ